MRYVGVTSGSNSFSCNVPRRTLPGVRRPGIAVTLDLTGQPVTILDMGANIAPKPQDLYQPSSRACIKATPCCSAPTSIGAARD